MTPEILRFIRYLSFKQDCLRHQEAEPLTIDLTKAQKHYDELDAIVQEKTEALAKVMPKVPDKMQNKPKVLYKKDGSYSAYGKNWFDTLKQLKLPPDTEGPVVVSWKDGNPGSTPQVKEWLESLGWEPCTFKFTRNKLTGEEKQIPQVRYVSPSDPRKGQLTDSVLRLKDRAPEVEILEGLTVAQHRRSIFEGFLSESDEQGNCVASAGGLTNTLRLKHRKPVVNLPGVDAWYGPEVRGCIVAPPTSVVCSHCGRDMSDVATPECSCGGMPYEQGQVLCGSDVSSLESMTKRNFMWPYDPDYVEEMAQPGFDEHINLAKFAGAISQEDEDRYSRGEGSDLKPIRTIYKPVNYAGVYGIRPKGLSRQTGFSIKRCEELLDAYWKRNWSVNKIAQDQYVKTLKDGTKWLKNPISGFYYSLRFDKDCFSTLNQGTGVFIFDCWVMRMRRKGINPQLQYHDEVLFSIPKGQEEQVEQALRESMQEVNESLKLNVTIDIDVQFGESYADVH